MFRYGICWGWAVVGKKAYEALFIVSAGLELWRLIWKSWSPKKCLWLVAHNRCWMAGRLSRRGLPHPECCQLYDQNRKQYITSLPVVYLQDRPGHSCLGIHNAMMHSSCVFFLVEIPSGKIEQWDITSGINDKNPSKLVTLYMFLEEHLWIESLLFLSSNR